MPKAIYFHWFASDEGTPREADGSLHLSKDDLEPFYREMRAAEAADAVARGLGRGYVPGYYVRPSSRPPIEVEVDDATYAEIVASAHGIRARGEVASPAVSGTFVPRTKR